MYCEAGSGMCVMSCPGGNCLLDCNGSKCRRDCKGGYCENTGTGVEVKDPTVKPPVQSATTKSDAKGLVGLLPVMSAYVLSGH